MSLSSVYISLEFAVDSPPCVFSPVSNQTSPSQKSIKYARLCLHSDCVNTQRSINNIILYQKYIIQITRKNTKT